MGVFQGFALPSNPSTHLCKLHIGLGKWNSSAFIPPFSKPSFKYNEGVLSP